MQDIVNNRDSQKHTLNGMSEHSEHNILIEIFTGACSACRCSSPSINSALKIMTLIEFHS
jgi:Fe-S cluster biogenesis protein NfuA